MRKVLIIAALTMCAAPAMAQFPGGGMGGGMGGMGGGRGGMGGMGGRGGMQPGARAQNMKFPSAKTLQKYNPADLLLDEHKKLKLTDDQQTQLKTIRQQIYERNAAILARYDSAQKNFTPPQMGGPSGFGGGFGGGFVGGRRGGEGGGRMGGDEGEGGGQRPTRTAAQDSALRASMEQMRTLRLLVDSLQERRRADVRDAITVLADDAQKKKAAEYLDKQDIKFSEEFPQLPERRERGQNGGPPDQYGGRGQRPPTA